ncbi:hypothetical protein Droror1_Dr00023571 [Drosera rotundifolia]
MRSEIHQHYSRSDDFVFCFCFMFLFLLRRSLELQVKRLEEEREKTSKTMIDDVEGGADLIVLETNGNGSRSRSPAGSDDGDGSDEIDDDDHIKDYDGGSLMECKTDPKLPYTDLSTMIHRQRQAIDEKIRENYPIVTVYPGIDFPKKEADVPKRIIKLEDIPGLSKSCHHDMFNHGSLIGLRIFCL